MLWVGEGEGGSIALPFLLARLQESMFHDAIHHHHHHPSIATFSFYFLLFTLSDRCSVPHHSGHQPTTTTLLPIVKRPRSASSHSTPPHHTTPHHIQPTRATHVTRIEQNGIPDSAYMNDMVPKSYVVIGSRAEDDHL